MRGYIHNKLITESTLKLSTFIVGVLLVITLGLTTALSILALGRISYEFLLANLFIGTIIPAFVAPLAINLFKQVNAAERANIELNSENAEIRRLEKIAEQKANDMQAVNELAIKCAAATPDTDIYKLIAEELRGITNALGVAITVYDPAAQTLTTKHVAVSGHILSSINELIGFNLIGMVNKISPEVEDHMLNSTVDIFADLHEVSFGYIPKPVASMITSTLGISRLTGLALSYAGKLIGSAVIAERNEASATDMDVYRTLAHVAAVSIQRKHAEDALRENEDKFRTLIENLSEGIFLLDEHGTVIEWNPSQETITDMPRKDAIGKPIWDIQYRLSPEDKRTTEFHAQLKYNFEHLLASEIAGKLHRRKTGIIHSLTGKSRHVLQSSFPVPSRNGNRIGSIIRDISSQVQIETERDALIAELQSKNTELEQFTRTVSHDLKAPLITIKGFLGLLENDIATGKLDLVKKDIHRITSAADNMQLLLDKLLELSRVGRVVNPPQEVAFDSIVQAAIASVQGRLDASNIKVVVAADLPVVFVDQVRVKQVVQNLVDNAAKFMGEQPSPMIEVGAQNEENGMPVLFVKDNGAGIDPDHLDKLFGLFQKLDTGVEGTGVGLAIVKRIIEVHGGRVWITSAGLGHGTTVYFTLPVR